LKIEEESWGGDLREVVGDLMIEIAVKKLFGGWGWTLSLLKEFGSMLKALRWNESFWMKKSEKVDQRISSALKEEDRWKKQKQLLKV
jgi:hypothetical protein